MKLTPEQAKSLLVTEPFIILYTYYEVYLDADGELEDDSLYASIPATNINNEHCHAELVKHLERTARDCIADIPTGASFFLCQMRFIESHVAALYSYDDFLGAYETDEYWEIDSYELLSNEPIMAQGEP